MVPVLDRRRFVTRPRERLPTAMMSNEINVSPRDRVITSLVCVCVPFESKCANQMAQSERDNAALTNNSQSVSQRLVL